MRKYQQNLILDMLKLCKCKHDIITHLPCQNSDDILDNLAICKNYAEQSIEFIEKIQGKGTRAVCLLKKYCTMLCQMRTGGMVKDLNSQLIRISNCVKNELKPDRLEIAFFPYKASMADSLETIYLTAKEDPQCDAYWIPIPYFDKTIYGTLGKRHYEGTEYPDYFEVTDWQAYNVEMRHPDVVFIVNPYDDINRVTTVHPDYYSKALKANTDLLVYVDYGIPYWMAKNAESYVTNNNVSILPGQMNCDLYATYSNETAEVFRVALLRSNKTKGLYNRKIVCEKVVPLGSPKFDRIFNTRKEECKIPDNWRTMIGDKKVLLYNTSLAELLQNSEAFFDELNCVIGVVRKEKNIVLWWRPHPLTKAAISCMRPHLAAKYEDIIEAFKNDSWGIYDETSDLHRSIAWSDGCLTTESSLMFLYLATGKPFTVMSLKKRLKNPNCDQERYFTNPLKRRIQNMKAGKGAVVGNWKCCVWWDNFLQEDILRNVHYDNFLERFIHYILNMESYPEAEEYRQLQLQIFRDFVINSDGTAGTKIYQYCKERLLR